MGNLSGESREQNRTDKVTRFRSVMYARQLGLLVNTLESHLNMIIGFGITTKCIASTFKTPILIESVLNKLFCSLSLNCYYLCSQRADNYTP